MNKGNDLKVPTGGQIYGEEEKEAARKVIDSGQWASYKISEQFEHEFSSYVGKRYGLFVNSGSSANLIAVETWKEIGFTWQYPIITAALAFPTTINPLIQTGRQIRLCDIDIETLLPGERASYGAMTLGNYHDGFVIEDSCDAMWPDKYTGLAQTFSFYPAHHMSTGEGGMITTDDHEFYKIARSFRDWGRDCWCLPGVDNTCGKRFNGDSDHKYTYSRVGYNLKSTEIQAAIGIEQLKKLPQFTLNRIRNFNHLYNGLKKYSQYFILPKSTLPNTAWFGFPLTIKDNVKITRKEMVNFLNNRGVATRIMLGGNISKQPAYTDVQFIYNEPLTNTDKINNDSFWFGCWHGLSIEQLDYVISTIGEFLNVRD